MPRKRWSKTVEAHGFTIRLYERAGGTIYRSIVVGRTTSDSGKERAVEDRRSLKTKDRQRAEKIAEALALELARRRYGGADATPGAPVTLGAVFDAYQRHHAPMLSPARQKEADSRVAMFTEAWGRDLAVADIGRARIEAYCDARRSCELVSPGLRPGEDGKRRRGYRKPRPIQDGGLDAEFRWLNSVFNFACDFKIGGRPLLNENPLPTSAKRRRAVGWPVERNPRRPVASQQRFEHTMRHVDAVDPEGRLGCILGLARWTGRRESAICAIRASDLLMTTDRIGSALAAAGMDVRMADHMPHGAIRWAAESDKMGLLFVSPISRKAREALDAYLRRNPRAGDVPLFPAPKDASKPIRRELAAKWLMRAERLAELPKLVGGRFHPYRRLWASERKNLPDVDVAAAGGWSDTQALRLSYQQADPATVLAVVENGG